MAVRNKEFGFEQKSDQYKVQSKERSIYRLKTAPFVYICEIINNFSNPSICISSVHAFRRTINLMYTITYNNS